MFPPSMKLLESWNTQATAWDLGREIRVVTQRCSDGDQSLRDPRNQKAQDTHISRHISSTSWLCGQKSRSGTLDLAWTDRQERQKNHPGVTETHWRPASLPCLYLETN